MKQDELKRAAAHAALDYVVSGAIIGVGTGSTVNFFIEGLADMRARIAGAVSSSEASAERLRRHGIEVLDLNEVIEAGGEIPVYVDGADEINPALQMIKGGGGALTREKIVAEASDRFICIVDRSKVVDTLGRFPLPIEVIPMAARLVAARIRALGGEPRLRSGPPTDNGNLILDVAGLSIEDPRAFEHQINQWAGVVTVGLFAGRPASVALVASADGIERMQAQTPLSAADRVDGR